MTEDASDLDVCHCPVCGAEYRFFGQRCCPHIVTDWCSTSDSPGGMWAADDEACTPYALQQAVADFVELVEPYIDALPKRKVVALFPRHLRDIPRDAFESSRWSLESYLGELVRRSPG